MSGPLDNRTLVELLARAAEDRGLPDQRRRALRHRFPHATILAVSGEPGLLDTARALHVQGTLQKPFAVGALLEAVLLLLRLCEA